ncbi:hypothetical protein CANMA_001741 [Candida margitis]|uniref:uncharacterized protein n=1 Tax=Candida margitis TaxID=1775924 RepID=UPI0022277FBA|nr:uncharacterized protein CANMA_001741 [Candida margitis]KAI5969188.1 hypothetical protein CANMA_001741 [Candida margitis]
MPSIDEDEKTIQLLNLLNEYQELTGACRSHFINGFLNLSRANFQSEKTKFGKDTFDMRSYDACKIVGLMDESDEFNIVDRTKTSPGDAVDDDQFTNDITPASELKNRKNRNANTAKTETEKTATITYRDPILQFGALTPSQLKTSQEDFGSALNLSVRIINIRRKIETLVSELERH